MSTRVSKAEQAYVISRRGRFSMRPSVRVALGDLDPQALKRAWRTLDKEARQCLARRAGFDVKYPDWEALKAYLASR